MMRAVAVLLLVCVGAAFAQDPAEGWMGYAKGVSPTGQGKITYMEAKWTVGNNPRRSGAFFSPWFGIESSDNLNLIQPVNPWTGSQWQIYNEYFQWRPEHNENSDSHVVRPGDVLFGSVTFNPSRNSYTIYHSDLNDGWSVSTEIPIQKINGQFKTYNIIYFVYEKVWSCDLYPTDGEVVFFDIKVEYDNQQVVPIYTTDYVDDNCNNRAHVLNDTAISITWDTSAEASNHKLIELRGGAKQHTSYGRRLAGRRPTGRHPRV
eukprot:m.51421 g.51421  ORF g.51421 m.51421 type:complete len:262 (-) comp12988_c0_seq1:46-831(-)